MKLLQNEKELISAGGNQFMLTNYRIMKNDEVMGKSYRIDIFLENISSIESQYKSNPILLILAGISLLAGFVMRSSDAMIAGIVLGALLVAIWWFTRKHIVTIKPNGGNSLNILIEKMSNEKVNDFIFNIQEAKLNRLNYLYSKNQ